MKILKVNDTKFKNLSIQYLEYLFIITFGKMKINISNSIIYERIQLTHTHNSGNESRLHGGEYTYYL